jgi:hypothetical protein
MKAKLQQFYQHRIQPMLDAAKAKMAQIKHRLLAWFHRRRQGLQLAAGIIAGLLAGATLTYLWLTAPALQVGVYSTLTHTSLFLTGLWAFVKIPFRTPEPVLVAPHPRLEDEAPVQVNDGRLL